MGTNVASSEGLPRLLFSHSEKQCIFISHKKEDESAAVAIGKYLTDIADINIYLDLNDCELREAVSRDNDEKIVNSIMTGLGYSTHLLCLISDKTRLSWWVPYEIGFSAKKEMSITSLKLKTIDDIPSYLKINKVLYNVDDFMRYASEFSKYGTLFSEQKYEALSSRDNSLLKQYIDLGEDK